MRNLTSRLQFGLPLLLSMVSPLHASLTGVDFFKNIEYSQTSGAAPSTPSGYFVSSRAFFANPGDFNTGSLTYPGPGSPQTLSPAGPTVLLFQTGFLASQAAMDAAFPFGTYDVTATNTVTSTSQSANILYSTDAYASSIPALTAATFAALQGMNPSNAFTFNFNAFTPNALATSGSTFFTIFGTPISGAHPSSTTSFTLDPNTLLPNTTYTFEVDFSDRISGTNNGVPTTLGFDVRTDGTFTTGAAVPEPAGVTLGALGVAALALGLRRRAPARSL